MKYSIRISAIATLLSIISLVTNAQITKVDVAPNSTLSCMQGIWKPVNSTNYEISEFVIYNSYHSLEITYTSDFRLESLGIIVDGFVFSEKNFNLKDSLQVSRLRSDGNYYLWFFEEDVHANGWGRPGGALKDISCTDNVIELTDNAMTVLNKQLYLPYTAYHLIVEKSKRDKRDYLKEFEIKSKLKTAIVTSDRAYFYNGMSEDSKTKRYIVQGDRVIIDQINNGWIKCAYEGKKVTTYGWIRASNIMIDASH